MEQFKVLVAVDDSPQASDALQWYLDSMYAPNHLVILTHAAEQPSLPVFKFSAGLNPPADEWARIMKEHMASIRRLEEDYQQRLIHKKIQHKIRPKEDARKPGEGIIEVAVEENAGMIIMGTRGQSKYSMR